jgi:sugar phosphate isomerase/epimerase
MSQNLTFSVFTKPWKQPLHELCQLVKSLGFDGIELPVRPGYQVEPENVSTGLPEAVKNLEQHDLKIYSVAGPTDEATIAACATCHIPVIRICVGIDDSGYMACESRLQHEYDALVPLLEMYGVTLGIQNHCDRNICNAMGLRHLIEKYNPKNIAAVWDAAHNALNGEDPEMAIDIIWSHLCMVNLKNAFWQRTNGPEAEVASWRPYWTLGCHGLASWPRVAAELKKRAYKGVICLPAEYSDEPAVNRLIAEDIRFAKSLFL